MLTVFGLILPIFLLIAGGYWARRSGFLPEGFWGPAEKLGYWVLLPALIVQSVATRTVGGAEAGRFALAIVLVVAGVSAAVHLAARFAGMPGPAFASLHQGCLRLNGLIAIAAALSLLGPDSLPYVAIMVAVWVPASNGLSVWVFVRSASGSEGRPGRILLEVLRNPMIASVLVGLLLNVVGLGPFLERFILLELLGRAALPIGLLAVGAGLDLQAAGSAGPRVAAAVAVKLLVMPIAMIDLCRLLELSPLASAVAVLSACMPTSPSGYLVARHLGGDASLMASIVTVQTAVAVVTVTLFATWAVQMAAG